MAPRKGKVKPAPSKWEDSGHEMAFDLLSAAIVKLRAKDDRELDAIADALVDAQNGIIGAEANIKGLKRALNLADERYNNARNDKELAEQELEDHPILAAYKLADQTGTWPAIQQVLLMGCEEVEYRFGGPHQTEAKIMRTIAQKSTY